MELTRCQEQAKDSIESFLLSDQKELALSGAAGVGKSFILNQICSELDDINQMHTLLGSKGLSGYELTATTNKAATVINGRTIHSRLGLTVKNDYSTGDSYAIKTNRSSPIENKLIILDEASMCDRNLHKHIQDLTHDCKIIYSGDSYQLAPVKESKSPIFESDIPMVQMFTPVRQDAGSYLYEVCEQLRETVRTKQFTPLKLGEGVRQITDDECADFMLNQSSNDKILTFDNACAIRMNNHVRNLKGFQPDLWEEGELVVCNNMVKHHGEMVLFNEQPCIVRSVSSIDRSDPDLILANIALENGLTVKSPVFPEQYTKRLKQHAKDKDWQQYFELKEAYADLRGGFTSTVHKSQGSSYDRVLINLNNLSKCKNKSMLARLLYVAFSRAKQEVLLYGSFS